MAERPDVLAAFRGQSSPEQFTRFFTEWFLHRGAADYGHAWLMSADEVAFKVRQTRAASGSTRPGATAVTPNLPTACSFPMDRWSHRRRRAGRAPPGGSKYRQYEPHYPCVFLDMSDPNTALSAVVTGEAQPALRGGLDLLSSFMELRLPNTRQSTVVLRLELVIPEPLRK